MLYLFARVAEDRWEMLRQNWPHRPPSEWGNGILGNDKLAQVPWAILVCAEPGAIKLSELLGYWGMIPGNDPVSDRVMYRFLTIARGRRPAGGDDPLAASPSGTAVFAEDRLQEWEAAQSVRGSESDRE